MNIEGKGNDSGNNVSEPLSTTDQTHPENDAHHEFIARDPPELEQNKKYSHMIS